MRSEKFISRKPLINSKVDYNSIVDGLVRKKKGNFFFFIFGSLFWYENYLNMKR